MPKPGFRSITVPEEFYDILVAFYDKRKRTLEYNGINSMSSLAKALMAGFNADVRREFDEYVRELAT